MLGLGGEEDGEGRVEDSLFKVVEEDEAVEEGGGVAEAQQVEVEDSDVAVGAVEELSDSSAFLVLVFKVVGEGGGVGKQVLGSGGEIVRQVGTLLSQGLLQEEREGGGLLWNHREKTIKIRMFLQIESKEDERPFPLSELS